MVQEGKISHTKSAVVRRVKNENKEKKETSDKVRCLICVRKPAELSVSVKGHILPLCEDCATELFEQLAMRKGINVAKLLIKRAYEWFTSEREIKKQIEKELQRKK